MGNFKFQLAGNVACRHVAEFGQPDGAHLGLAGMQ